MLRTFLRAAVVLSAVALAPSALADMGSAGTIYVGAERLFGFSANSVKDKQTDGSTITRSSTDVGLLWNPAQSVYTIPRLGLDFAVIPNLTVGGSIGFASSSQSAKSEGNGTSVDKDGDTITSFLFAPRVGYIIGLGDKFGLWLRGGVTYYNISNKGPEQNGGHISNTNSGLGFSLDPIFVVSPVEHFGFFGGLMIDLPLTGTRKNETVTPATTESRSFDSTAKNIGLNLGLIGYF